MSGDQQSTETRTVRRPEPADARDENERRFGAAWRLARAVYPANVGLAHTVDFPASAR